MLTKAALGSADCTDDDLPGDIKAVLLQISSGTQEERGSTALDTVPTHGDWLAAFRRSLLQYSFIAHKRG